MKYGDYTSRKQYSHPVEKFVGNAYEQVFGNQSCSYSLADNF